MFLPADIVDLILSFLQSDPTSLDACRRSHPLLSQLAERHLYHDITIQTRELNFKLGHQPLRVFGPGNLTDILSDRPHIGSYVRSLRIHIFNHLKSQPVVSAYLLKVASVLPRFPILRKIDLEVDLIDCHDLTWPSLPETFQLAFLDCFRLPSLTEIGITSVRLFRLSALNDCPQLRRLSLVNYSHFPIDVNLQDHVSNSALESIHIKNIATSCIWTIGNWMHIRGVRSLHFENLRTHDFGQLLNLLSRCSDSLTSLHLRIANKYRTYYDFNDLDRDTHPSFAPIPIVLASLPHLKHLTISADLEYVDNYSQPHESPKWGFLSPIPAITQFLKTASPLQHLTLDFHFVFETYDPESVFLVEVFSHPLAQLLSETSLPSTTLDFHASEKSGNPISPAAILPLIDCEELMRFVKRGSLSFVLNTTESPALARDPRQSEILPELSSSSPPPVRTLVRHSTRPKSKWHAIIKFFCCR